MATLVFHANKVTGKAEDFVIGSGNTSFSNWSIDDIQYYLVLGVKSSD